MNFYTQNNAIFRGFFFLYLNESSFVILQKYGRIWRISIIRDDPHLKPNGRIQYFLKYKVENDITSQIVQIEGNCYCSIY